MSDPYSLNNLRDIIEPTGISSWPPALPVILLGMLLLVWLLASLILLIVHYRKNLYRRVGLRELAVIEQRLDVGNERPVALRDLNILIKRVALAAWPRDQVAHLAGDAWLAFLAGTSRGALFANGSGSLLKMIPVARDAELESVSPSEIFSLLNAARHWIKAHRVITLTPPPERPQVEQHAN